MGGQKMKEAGVEICCDIRGLAITGIVEVFVRFPRVIGAFRKVVDSLAKSRPAVAVLIDAPEFNIRLARRAHALGIPVIYYISPQVWAWRSHRIRELARLVKKMLVILPFEADVYRKAGMDVEFVGHPLLDQGMSVGRREEVLSGLGIDPDHLVLCLLPGSRNNELEYMGPTLARVASLVESRQPKIQAVVGLASTVPENRARRIFGRFAPQVPLIVGRTYDLIGSSDLAIAAAGTVTLEAALIGTPLMVIYRTSLLSYFIARQLVRVDHVALVNLVAGKRVVPEFIQDEANPEALAEVATQILGDPTRRAVMRADLAGVRELLGSPGASRRAAEAVVSFLHEHESQDSQPVSAA